MKASLHSVRIAPKKANLIAKMIRGMSAAEAMHVLERTNKKAARLLEELLRSAMANASHNDKQDAQTLVIRSLIVNQGQAYRRGVPMARGRVRPMRKFMSHIELVLGLEEDEDEGVQKNQKKQKSQRSQKSAKISGVESSVSTSRKSKNPVQVKHQSSASSESSSSSVSS